MATAIAGFLISTPGATEQWLVIVALVAVVPTAIAGWMDDRGASGVAYRLGAQMLSALLLLPLALNDANPLWLRALIGAGWIFATISAVNVVNFMDGLDGFIGLQSLVFAIHLAIFADSGSPLRTFGVTLAAATVGFLIWNWSPAKIFLGDVGSGSIAVLGLVGGILLLQTGRLPFIAVFLPLFPIFLDASVTIVRRIGKGEPLAQAHRSHLYQRLANEQRWGHVRVSLLYGAAAMAGMLVVAVLPIGGASIIAACGVYMAVVVLMGWFLHRRAKVRPVTTGS